MKKLIFTLTALVFCASVGFAQKGVMKFKEETHKFGNVEQNVPASHEFVFTNTGKDPVVIKDALASCGCTKPEFTKQPIAPGKTGIVKATFNAAAIGPFNKSVTVTSNAESPTITLFLNGTVVKKGELAATPKSSK